MSLDTHFLTRARRNPLGITNAAHRSEKKLRLRRAGEIAIHVIFELDTVRRMATGDSDSVSFNLRRFPLVRALPLFVYYTEFRPQKHNLK